MTHKDGRVVLSAWVEPVLRDYAREAARAAGVQFSLWVEGAVQRAVAEQSAEKALRIYPVHASHLTDVVTLLEDERDEARAEVERLQERVATQDDGLRYGEKVCADLVAQIEGLRGKLDALATAHERDLIAIWRVLGNYHEPPSSSESVIDAVQLMRDERRQLRARLVECRPWVGVVPYPNTPGFSEMIAIRDLADDTLEEVKP